MLRDEAISLAQILLGLLLFTVGILPTLLVQLNVEEPIKRVFLKRIRTFPMFAAGMCTLVLVVVLVVVPPGAVVVSAALTQSLVRALTSVSIVFFVLMWYHIYKHVTVKFVVADIARRIGHSLKYRGVIPDDDVDDLLRLGESVRGGEKDQAIEALGRFCGSIQDRTDYNGTQLQELLRGLQHVVVRNGTMSHHQSAHSVITNCWESLVQKNLVDDSDARVLREVAWVLGSLAVSPLMGSMPQRWMSSIPNVVDVPYQIGVTAIRAEQYPIAIEALARISWTAEARKTLPPQMIALVAHFHAAGPSAGRTAREFLDRLGHTPDTIRTAAENAASGFRGNGDYSTADAIGTFLDTYR